MHVALLLFVSLASHNPTPIPPPAMMEATGKVREEKSGEGIKTEAVIELDDKTEYVLHGHNDREDAELLRLAGVRIHVDGVKGDPLLPRGNHLRIDAYQIVDIGGGVVPRVGLIASMIVDGKQRLLFVSDDGHADLLPLGYGAKMTKNIGARVWIVGQKEKNDLIPSRFGILRVPRDATVTTAVDAKAD